MGVAAGNVYAVAVFAFGTDFKQLPRTHFDAGAAGRAFVFIYDRDTGFGVNVQGIKLT